MLITFLVCLLLLEMIFLPAYLIICDPKRTRESAPESGTVLGAQYVLLKE